MFAPPVAKAKTKVSASSNDKTAHERSTFVAQRFSGGAVEQMLFLQRTVGDQATLRLLSQRAGRPGGSQPSDLSIQETERMHVSGRAATPGLGWDFSKIPLFSPEQARPSQAKSPLTISPLPGIIQPKLIVGEVNDPLEHEADRVAEHVVRMPEPNPAANPVLSGAVPGVQRACACGGECDECQKKQQGDEHAKVQLKTAGPGGATLTEVPAIVQDVLISPGQPLDAATRAFFEPRFGHDFSKIRVHTDARAAESARAVNARAYTVGHQIVFGSGQYGLTAGERARLMAHELTHVMQQGASSKVAARGDRVEDETNRAGDGLVNSNIAPPSIAHSFSPLPSTMALQRQPQTSTVQVGKTQKQLTQGTGGSGAIVYEYTAVASKEPPDHDDLRKPGKSFDITLPLLVYPPAVLNPPKVNIFVFFHGMRATYEEGTKTQKSQGSEPIALWSHLKEAVAGTDRLGIAPQAPATWAIDKTGKHWMASNAQWNEALGKVGFDGLINIALSRLTTDLGLSTPLVPGEIHVAGHSAGGKGIIEATSLAGGGKTFGDQIQDVTLQDAGYGFSHWDHLMDWFLEGTPGKTVRVLVSQEEGGTLDSPGNTRNILKSWFNVSKINKTIEAKKKTDTLEVVEVTVPKPEDQKPRQGGFVLESQLQVNNKKIAVTQGTLVVFFAPGGKHYPTVTASMGAAAAAGPKITADFLGEAKPGKYRVISNQDSPAPVFKDKDLSKQINLLKRDTVVDVIALELKKPTSRKDKATQPYIANVKTADGVKGWMLLANLAGK